VIRRAVAWLGMTALLTTGYVIAGELALAIAFVHTSISPVWVPSGVAVAAVWRYGYRAAPGILLGAFVVNALDSAPLWSSLPIGVCNMLEAATASWLLRRYEVRQEMDRARDVVAFAMFAAAASTAVSATGGVSSLRAAGALPSEAMDTAWLLWWSGDAVGILTVTPLLLLVLRRRRWPRLPRGQLPEAACLVASVALVSWIGLATHAVGPFVVFPVLTWAAMRFGHGGANLTCLFIAATVVWATGHGRGPFVEAFRMDSLLLTQSFVAVVMATGLLLAAMTAERERVNSELLQATIQIEQRNAELQRSNAELTALDQLKDSFVATVSHELRTPLTSIRGYTEILVTGETGPLTDMARKAVNVIDENGRRLQKLIEDLLTVANVQASPPTVRRDRVDLRSLAISACERAKPSTGKAGLTLEVDAPSDVPAVLGEADQLDRALDNLLSNAIKFSLPGGTVTIRIGHDDHVATVEVIDTGIGVPTDEQHRLFDRFFRSSLARENAIGGTGLGLTIAKSIVDAHGGRISATSGEGVGTTVTFTIPLAPCGPHQAEVADTSRGRLRVV
jgi:signal transduction histidine kinase